MKESKNRGKSARKIIQESIVQEDVLMSRMKSAYATILKGKSSGAKKVFKAYIVDYDINSVSREDKEHLEQLIYDLDREEALQITRNLIVSGMTLEDATRRNALRRFLTSRKYQLRLSNSVYLIYTSLSASELYKVLVIAIEPEVDDLHISQVEFQIQGSFPSLSIPPWAEGYLSVGVVSKKK